MSKSLNICVIGDFFNKSNVKNFGWVKREKACDLIKKSKLSINSAENFLSIFGIDCVNFGTNVIYDSHLMSSLKYIKNIYTKINFTDVNHSSLRIRALALNFKRKQNIKWWSYIVNEKEKIRNFVSSYTME